MKHSLASSPALVRARLAQPRASPTPARARLERHVISERCEASRAAGWRRVAREIRERAPARETRTRAGHQMFAIKHKHARARSRRARLGERAARSGPLPRGPKPKQTRANGLQRLWWRTICTQRERFHLPLPHPLSAGRFPHDVSPRLPLLPTADHVPSAPLARRGGVPPPLPVPPRAEPAPAPLPAALPESLACEAMRAGARHEMACSRPSQPSRYGRIRSPQRAKSCHTGSARPR